VSRDAIRIVVDAGIRTLQLEQPERIGPPEEHVLEHGQRAGETVAQVDLGASAFLHCALQSLTGGALEPGHWDREAGCLMRDPEIVEHRHAPRHLEAGRDPRLGRELGLAVPGVDVEAKSGRQRDAVTQVEDPLDPGSGEDLVPRREQRPHRVLVVGWIEEPRR
jgi:hypothetical protein